MLNTIEEALAELRAGRPVLVTDDADRENEGDAILAAQLAGPHWVGWMVRHTSGYLCAPMTDERADQLGLPLMWPATQDPLRTRYTVSVDAASGITTGIDAAQRARTARVLANATSTPADLIRPGHVLPLRARTGGVLERRGHTEAAVDLARLAGLEPVGLIGELVGDDGMCLRTEAIATLARTEGLAFITIDELAQWRRAHDPAEVPSAPRVTALASAHLPTRYGQFAMTGYRDNHTGAEHVLLVSGKGIDADDGGPAWVRVHSECLTGDALGSLRCDCGDQLAAAQAHVSEHGGAIILLRGHEGRATGLLNKIAAYQAQDGGLDTVDAQTHLGLPIDAREYGAAVAILAHAGLSAVRLLTNNPAKVEALRAGGLDVTMSPLEIPPRPEDERYLRTKRDRMGHLLAADHSISEITTFTSNHPSPNHPGTALTTQGE
ncbi:3,4-dihydroxy-2-butanone-4-phosphate synthase [Cutibacterium equinum]|uniref:GTP cyclohydrolase-2 n=1 Tax=Cutibacterium equinum TaxID=3016342 RepID=A0ABY7QXP2_9ACTN|nr:3,4-dihydroxy-2-butanone-4-phosphate synthase [Cutibacterium equinum]WCC79445.1 3,4-dihydroxy-2-butanone-4-phosphate synthase [Cutibacterium equinum]